MGHSIKKRHISVIEVLLKNGVQIGEVFRQHAGPGGALDLFFDEHKYRGNDLGK